MDNLMILETSFWKQKIFQEFRNLTTNYISTDCNSKALNYNLENKRFPKNDNTNFILKLMKLPRTMQSDIERK